MSSCMQTVTNNVSLFKNFLPELQRYLKAQVDNFQAGRLSNYLDRWQTITTDKEILQTVEGMTIDFIDFPTHAYNATVGYSLSELDTLQTEVAKLIKKGVVVRSEDQIDQFKSPIFLRRKPDGTFRLILNLKNLNTNLEYNHFKMTTLQSILTLVRKNCFMTSIDLKDAYYSIKVKPELTKFLKFELLGVLYEFCTLPNGLSQGPRKFTKLTKPPLSCLRKEGVIVDIYIDDLFNTADSFEECLQGEMKTISLFHDLGFVIHPEKSQFVPSQQITYLGFVIDSQKMQVRLTEEKKLNIIEKTKIFLKPCTFSIREVASFIGTLTSSLPGILYGPLHYRNLERDKNEALKYAKGNFNNNMRISPLGSQDILWFKNNIMTSYAPIEFPRISQIIYTDASLTGWGACWGNQSTGGTWLEGEKEQHINVLELKAVLFGLKCFVKEPNKHIKIFSDNTTTIACINKKGTSRSPPCHAIALHIWEWAESMSTHLTAAHVPGVENIEADKESRKLHIDGEWMIDSVILKQSFAALNVEPEIDIFASRVNRQLNRYISYNADPEAEIINAFTIEWDNFKFYAFPPFAIIGQVLKKISSERSEGVLVVPLWPNQSWYPIIFKMIISIPIIINSRSRLLRLPSEPERTHPLWKKLDLLVCHISGNKNCQNNFQQTLSLSLNIRGERKLTRNMLCTFASSRSFVMNEMKIPFRQLKKQVLNSSLIILKQE